VQAYRVWREGEDVVIADLQTCDRKPAGRHRRRG
jgi:hypothetical protein